MALRIGEYVRAGELRNNRRNGVYGWIEFAADYGIRIELTGNLKGELEGKNFRLQVPLPPDAAQLEPGTFPDEIEQLADRQIGVVGEMELRSVRIPLLPLDQWRKLSPQEKIANSEEQKCLYLEWFSQNGRVVAEILAPEIELLPDDLGDDDSEDEDEERYGLGFTEVRVGEDDETGNNFVLDGSDEEDDEEEEDDNPYGLFDENLDRKVAESLGPIVDQEFDEREPPSEGGLRAWDQAIPGLDPETKAMYEQWDEIFEGKKDEPLSYLFETPLKLPKPDAVLTDEEALPLVTAILAQLALLSVALDVCEHFTPLDTYQLLMTEILPTAKVHPNLAATEMVQHYSTSDYCDECEAEFERELGDDSTDSPDPEAT
ncbi:hypothetical protein [Aureliella helgolandensis]|uniref:Uncharacterized protein n=1 Tax=Aureliella helgolandensis TaxID=2527968 RepID=A0A518G0Z6_9BACT|nr:hypothetical protein [Aureliella helgolandensis]QDV22269.1 hypothetical protein Q31a_05530 [Aureliella helgolandensis]